MTTQGPSGGVAKLGRILPIFFFIYVLLMLIVSLIQLAAFPLSISSSAPGTTSLTITISAIIAVPIVVTFCGLPLLFLIWQAKAAAAIVKRWDTKFPPTTPGRQIWSWFIPIVNLILPLFALGNLYRASQAGPNGDWKSLPFPRAVLLWWFFFYAGPYLSLLLLGAVLPDASSTSAEVFVMSGYLLASLYAAIIVRDVTDFQLAWSKEGPVGPGSTSASNPVH